MPDLLPHIALPAGVGVLLWGIPEVDLQQGGLREVWLGLGLLQEDVICDLGLWLGDVLGNSGLGMILFGPRGKRETGDPGFVPADVEIIIGWQ